MNTSASPTLLANAIRALAMDAVQKANSGHPGMPMGMADIAVALWNRHLKHNPANPKWPDRDRFVISNGHGSMLLYALLHLTGYDLPMEEIKNFRQLHSKTPGHPEYGITPGVETTTGPLGQGFSNAVGMAVAEELLASHFNRPGHDIVEHNTYVFMGDGCMMEGISHEAASLAGKLGLGRLTAFYDDNGISIDGKVEGWFTDDTPKRFEAYGWHVIPNVDGKSVEAVDTAIRMALAEKKRPTLICCKTVIGEGSPNRQGTAKAHGEALGKDEVALTREALGWKYEPFVIPKEIYEGWDARAIGAAAEKSWNDKFAAYERLYPKLAAEFKRRTAGELPANWEEGVAALIENANTKAETVATRKASNGALIGLAPMLPELVGGSADLMGSVFTNWTDSAVVKRDAAGVLSGNIINFGVREFGMAGITNGMVLHGGFITETGTFLTFSDYSRNALRMASLMKIRNIFVFTHDSIGLGEDGPTHQPVEHVSSLRLIPGMQVWRPCDTVETAVAWAKAIERRDGPSCLIFSRQNSNFEKRPGKIVEAIAWGGYVLADCAGEPKAVIIATGTEVELAIKAKEALAAENIAVRVVSMPCTQVFDAQDQAYRESVLPKGVPRVAVEAGVTDYWRKYVGLEGAVVGLDRFGDSAPAKDLYKFFEITAEHVAAAVKGVI
ncbi:MAG: transketolase [Betaproteobacteria bacterium]|nr:transketolase [Betaproteobacteria bacterium]